MAAVPLDPRAAQLLEHLHRGGTVDYTWAVRGPEKISFWRTIGRDDPTILNSQHNMYFGVHPCTAIPPTNSKGKPAAPEYVRSQLHYIAAINCLFAEFDAKDFEDGKPGAKAHILTLDPQPSVIVDSGGGYHCYWLLLQPFMLDSDEARARADRAQKGWVKLVGSDDGAKDLARVLRIPGTHNFKEAYAPNFPEVRIMRADFDRLFTFEALEALIPDAPPAKVRPARRAAADSPPVDIAGDVDLGAIARAAANLNRLGDWRRDEYEPWVETGMALSELGTLGFNLWEVWSRKSHKYRAGDCADKWATFTPGDGLTLRSLARWADEDDPPIQAAPDEPQTVAKLCRQVDTLYAQVEKLEQWRDWAMKVAALPTEKLSPAAKVVAFTLWPEMQSREERGLTEPASIWIEGKAPSAGLSAGTYGKRLTEVAQAGALVREEVPDPVTGHSKVLIAPAAWKDPTSWAPPEARNHGGPRSNAGRPALPLCDGPTCSPETPVTEAAVMTVEYTSACGKALGTHERSRRERIWAPDHDGQWTATPWKRVESPPINQLDSWSPEPANQQDALRERGMERSPVTQVECWPADEPEGTNNQVDCWSDPSSDPAPAVPSSQQPILLSRYKAHAAQRAKAVTS